MSSTNSGLKVVSAARKLIFVVPETDRVVEFPAEAIVSSYGKGNDKPAIVVHNTTDKGKELSPGVFERPDGTWQGARPGQFVILNEVPEGHALFVMDHLSGYSIYLLEDALQYLQNRGYGDQYTTDLAFVAGNLSPAGATVGLTLKDGKIEKLTAGIVKRDARDVMQVFRKEGQIYVDHGKGDPKVIEADILLRTYRNTDGTMIDLAAIPTVS